MGGRAHHGREDGDEELDPGRHWQCHRRLGLRCCELLLRLWKPWQELRLFPEWVGMLESAFLVSPEAKSLRLTLRLHENSSRAAVRLHGNSRCSTFLVSRSYHCFAQTSSLLLHLSIIKFRAGLALGTIRRCHR